MSAGQGSEIERLTEGEWERRRASRECAIHGHDWQTVNTMVGPVTLQCARFCGDPGYCVDRTSVRAERERTARQCQTWATERFDEHGPLDARGAALWDLAAWIRKANDGELS